MGGRFFAEHFRDGPPTVFVVKFVDLFQNNDEGIFFDDAAFSVPHKFCQAIADVSPTITTKPERKDVLPITND